MKNFQIGWFAFWISLSGIFIFLFDFGFQKDKSLENTLVNYYYFVLLTGVLSTGLRYYQNRELFKKNAFIFDLITVLFTFFIFIIAIFKLDQLYIANQLWVKFAILFTFIREFSEVRLNYKRTVLNPAQLFIVSFFGIIILGALLLKLPNATHTGISLMDALFTSTSAVCVTGLAVVDTGKHFTFFGQNIIMILIQVGGLGILTFASYFSYFFKGGTSYENQLALSDMTSSKKLGEVFSTLKYIIFITFGIELTAALFIYFSLPGQLFSGFGDKVFFSIFHSVSAFCNAGFSTLSNSLYEPGFKFNYFLHIVVIATFVLGGLGFPIVVNLLTYIRYKITTLKIFNNTTNVHKPWVLNLNSRITLITTISITVVGTIIFYFLEYNNTLAEHGEFGKLVTALFGATTPRTAGFNSIDSAAMTFPSLVLVLLLMWIGASPQSTGGGIKTSTFAIATLNILSIAKGKSKIEVFRREISDISVRRAFAIISLSLIVIGTGILCITVFDPNMEVMDIAFECFSAYSTVGLSLGITGKLTDASKLVLIIIMFVGRVSMLSVVIAVFKKVKHKNYAYPQEELNMN